MASLIYLSRVARHRAAYWNDSSCMNKGPNILICDLSNHANSRYFMTTKDLKPVQMRWAERLNRFGFVIEHIASRYISDCSYGHRINRDDQEEQPRGFSGS
jgi:hypothetical protein